MDESGESTGKAVVVGSGSIGEGGLGVENRDMEGVRRRKDKGICPVPKPGGLVGEILGFRELSTVTEGRKIVERVSREDGDVRRSREKASDRDEG